MKLIRSILGIHLSGKSNQSGYGGKGEDVAASFLESKGAKVIERNWYNKKGKRLGEIDIIARDGGDLVFVEVKSRKSTSKEGEILPEEAITPAKMRKIARVAESYIKSNKLWDSPWRIDAITVVFDHSDKHSVRHLKSIYF